MKKTFCFLLTLSIIAGMLLPVIPNVAADSDKCGENLTWYRDRETNTLVIEGTGEMISFSPRGYIALNGIPWYDDRRFISAIEVRTGVTSIGDAAFYELAEVTRATLPEGLTYIGSNAFNTCSQMRHIELPSTVTYIGSSAFKQCYSLEGIILPENVEYVGEFAFYECRDLKSIVIENPQCQISNTRGTLGVADTAIIYGYPNSTAEAYAKKNGYSFENIDTFINETEYESERYPSSINTLVKNREIWLDRTAAFAAYDFTQIGFMDFEGDGIPELFISQIAGSGEFSYNLFFKINNDSNTIYEIENPKADSGSQPDLNNVPYTSMMREKSTGRYVYLCEDYIRGGVDYSDTDTYFLYLTPSGQIDYTLLWSYSRERDVITYSYEENGDTIVTDEDTWRNYQAEFLSDYESLDVQIVRIEHEELRACNEQELADALMEMYKSFYENAQLDPYTGEDELNGESDETSTTPSNTNAKIVVYSDHSNLSIRRENNITLSAAVLVNGEPSLDVSGITFQIEDTSILKVNHTSVENNRVYAKMYGLKPGITNVVFSDSKTGCVVTVPITVYDDNYLFYTLDSVPTQHIEKYQSNFYNINGLYIDNYACSVNDNGTANVSFDVYNTNYSYAVVEVYDENGNMSDAAVIDKLTSNTTNFKEVLWDGTGFLIRDLIDGDFLTYRQETGFSKCTPIEVTIPKNGYIKIQTSPVNSFLTGFINSVDVLMTMNALANEVNDFDVNNYDFTKEITKKMVFDASYAQIIKDGDKLKQNLWKNITWETLVTSEAMGDFVGTIARNIDELHLGNLIAETAKEFGFSVGEEVVKHFMGPAGIALDAIFGLGKIENFVVQCADLADLCTAGAICIQNQGGGYRACQQVVVTGENSFAPDTSLSVFTVTIGSETLDILKDSNPEIYESIMNGRSYTYNISLINDGEAIQPNGKVTVCIPIPENLRLLAGGEIANIIPADIVVYRIEDNGTMTEMDIKIENGCIVFTTDHFSLYTIVWDDMNGDNAQSQLPWGYIILGVTVIGIGAICVGLFRKKRKR